MTKITIELECEQVDAIILKELQHSLEMNVFDYRNKVKVFDKRKDHRQLIESMCRTIGYFMVYEEYQDYIEEIGLPKKIKRNLPVW